MVEAVRLCQALTVMCGVSDLGTVLTLSSMSLMFQDAGFVSEEAGERREGGAGGSVPGERLYRPD